MTEHSIPRSAQVWVVRAGSRGRDAAAFERAGVVGLAFPPVHGLETTPREEAIEVIADAIAAESDAFVQRARGPEPASARARSLASWLVRFVHDVQLEDFVITPQGPSGDFLVGTVTGPYEMAAEAPVVGYPHFRRVNWGKRLRRDDVPTNLLPAMGAPMAIFLPGAQVQLRELIGAPPA